MEKVRKEEERAKEEMRVLTSRVAELEDVNKEVTGRLQQEQAEHEVSTHLQLVMMCMYIQMAVVGILESHLSVSIECVHLKMFFYIYFICLFVFN